MRWLAAACALAVVAGCGEDKAADNAGSVDKTAKTGGGDGGLAAEADAPKHPTFHIERLDAVRFVVDETVLTKLAIDLGSNSIKAKKLSAGYRLKGASAGSLLSKLGVLDGDVVVSVNGVSLAGLDDVDKAFAAARTASRVEATLLRNGVTVKRRYVFRSSLFADEEFSPVKTRRTSRYRMPPAKREFDLLVAAMNAGTRKTNPADIQVDRKVISAILKRDDLLRYGADSYVRKGRGLHVTSTESVYSALGLTPYDTVKMIDDEDVRSRYSFVDQLRTREHATEMRLSVVRLHEPMVIRIALVDGVVKDDAVNKALNAWEQAAGLAGSPTGSGPYGGLTGSGGGSLGGGGGLGGGGLAPNPYPPAPIKQPSVDLATYVKKISESEYEIDRKLIDTALSQPALFAKARIVPSVNPKGFKLFAIRPGSIWHVLGLRNGDVVLSVNGHDLSTPDEALYLYGKIKDAKKLRMKLRRRGKGKTITFVVKN